jgi:glycerol-3-phosphate dehydrogenase subunit C
VNPHHRLNPDDCTACAVCTVHCPVAEATLAFRGPKQTGPAYERFRLAGFSDDASIEYCSNCKNCDISCPSGVPVATFNMLARAAYSGKRGIVLRDLLIGHSGDIGKALRRVPACVVNFSIQNAMTRRLLDLVGLDRRAPLPAFAPSAERDRLRKGGQAAAASAGPSSAPARRGTVALFPGCFVNYYEPRVGTAVIGLLEKAGYEVIVPAGFACCGLPLVCGGLMSAARKRALTNSRALARLIKHDIPVITPCPSCALMLRHEYRDLFPDEEEFTDNIADIHEACSFFLGVLDRKELSLADARPPREQLAYHAPCHLRALGLGRPGIEVLQRIPGLRIEDTDAGCCGMSGSYELKKGHYEIGMRIGAALFKAVGESGATLAVSECGTCRVQIGHGAACPVAHPLTLLAECLNIPVIEESTGQGKALRRTLFKE